MGISNLAFGLYMMPKREEDIMTREKSLRIWRRRANSLKKYSVTILRDSRHNNKAKLMM